MPTRLQSYTKTFADRLLSSWPPTLPHGHRRARRRRPLDRAPRL